MSSDVFIRAKRSEESLLELRMLSEPESGPGELLATSGYPSI